MGVREGLLALLAEGRRHGYLLKLEFEAATGGAWQLNVGQVYDALQRLESAGLVAFDGEDDDGRKRYRLTDDGRARSRNWFFQEPVPHQLRDRDELSMKVLLAAHTGGAATALEVVAAQRSATMATLQSITQRKARAGPRPAFEELVHLDRLILQARAELDWLDLVEERLVAREAEGHDRTRAPLVDDDQGRGTPVGRGGRDQ